MSSLTPKQIVSELDRFIIGHTEAKKAVAIALRNRWRRQQVPSPLKEEILPKNILMMGPTGVGKTEIARRLARLADAPFIKVEATKFTEVGYVGRDVEQIIRDLVEIAVSETKERHRQNCRDQAKVRAESIILEALVGENASEETKEKFKKMLDSGTMEDTEIEVNVTDNGGDSCPQFDIPGGQIGVMNLADVMSSAMGITKTKKRKVSIKEARRLLSQEESEKLIDRDKIVQEAIFAVEQNGIVFIDEIDKICAKNASAGSGNDVSREGVQRDLLPLIEGCSVTTKYGTIKTDYILFIASGAFHVSKPSDLLPELQGRLPIRVELKNLTEDDFVRILNETDSSLIKQYKALLKVEKVEVKFSQEAIRKVAEMAAFVNQQVENIGARRLHTIIEKLLEDISFSANEQSGEVVNIDAAYVEEKVGALAKHQDLSKFIL